MANNHKAFWQNGRPNMLM